MTWRVVDHGDDPNVPRPEAERVFWKGSAQPRFFQAGPDLWNDLTPAEESQ